MKASEIAKIEKGQTMTMISGTNQIAFSKGVVLNFPNWKEKNKAWAALQKAGFETKEHWIEENEGLCQAPSNPFECTIMC